MAEPTLAELREAALRWCVAGHHEPAASTWRTVVTDTENMSGFGLVCTDPEHPGIPDIDVDRDEVGVYDCCPEVTETFSTSLAAYLVALLNADADAARPPKATITMNPDPPAVAEAIREVRRAGGLPRRGSEVGRG